MEQLGYRARQARKFTFFLLGMKKWGRERNVHEHKAYGARLWPAQLEAWNQRELWSCTVNFKCIDFVFVHFFCSSVAGRRVVGDIDRKVLHLRIKSSTRSLHQVHGKNGYRTTGAIALM